MSIQEKVFPVRLTDVARMAMRRWMVVCLTIVLGAALSALYYSTMNEKYTATAALTVSPMTTSPFSTAAVNQQINITTEREIFGSSAVAALAAEELEQPILPVTLQRNSKVAAPSGSQVLRVSVEDGDPVAAADHANAMAAAYLTFRAAGAGQIAANYIESLDAQIAELQAKPDVVDQDRQRIAQLEAERTGFSMVQDNPGRIIGYAAVPTEPSSFGLNTFLVGGLAGGLILGLVLAGLRERTDPLIRATDRMAAHFARPVAEFVHGNDEEPLRQVLRTIRRIDSPLARMPHPQPADSHVPTAPSVRPLVVGFVSLPPESSGAIFASLTRIILAHGLKVVKVPARDLDPEAIDAGWPAPALRSEWRDCDVVLVEVRTQLSGTRIAALGDCLDAVVVTARRTSKLRELRTLLRDFAALHGSAFIPVLVKSPGRRAAGWRAARESSNRIGENNTVHRHAELGEARTQLDEQGSSASPNLSSVGVEASSLSEEHRELVVPSSGQRGGQQ